MGRLLERLVSLRTTVIRWRPHRADWEGDRTEVAVVGEFELVAFDLAPSRNTAPREIRWELVAGFPQRRRVWVSGEAASFAGAKFAAEEAFKAAALNSVSHFAGARRARRDVP